MFDLNRTYVSDWLAFTRQLPDDSVDLYLSDPAYDSRGVLQYAPYRWAGVGTTARMGRGKAGSGSDDPAKLFPTIRNEDLPLLLAEVYRVLKPERHAYIMCDFPTMLHLWQQAIAAGPFGSCRCSGVTVPRGKPLVWAGAANEGEDVFERLLETAGTWAANLRQTRNAVSERELAAQLFDELAAVWSDNLPPASPIIWDKVAAGMGYSYRSSHEYILFLWKGRKRRLNDLGVPDVLRHQRVTPNRATVPTQKPEALFETLVRQSTQPGELVLDNFMGSGTTARDCLVLGRRWLGCDLNPTHVELANAIQTQLEAAA
jgi:DNA modification methylase